MATYGNRNLNVKWKLQHLEFQTKANIPLAYGITTFKTIYTSETIYTSDTNKKEQMDNKDKIWKKKGIRWGKRATPKLRWGKRATPKLQ